MTPRKEGEIRLFALPAFLLGLLLLFGGLLYWQMEAFQQAIRQETLSSIQEESELLRSLMTPLLEENRLQEARLVCDSFTRDSLRLTLIRQDGTVVADSTRHDPEALDNHLLRQEVQSALQGESMAVSRKSESTGAWMTYYATCLRLANGETYLLRTAVSTDRTSRLLHLARRLFWGTIALGAATVAFLTLYVLRRLYHPLRRLQESMDRIAEGALETPIPVPDKGIVRHIARHVQEMTEQLRQQLREMRQLEEFRKDFISNVSHEIKTPLTSIVVAAETIQETPGLPREQLERLVNLMCAQSQRLNRLVQDILALASLEHRQQEKRRDFLSVNLRQVAQEAVEECRDEAEQKDCLLSLAIPEKLQVTGDSQLLAQAIGNLLHNALKYSGSQSITLAASQAGEWITLACVDHGCGIPREHWPRIFERFYRVNKERSRSLGGTGLGLAIVKHIAQLHQGTVEIDETPGGGTTFRLRLPV